MSVSDSECQADSLVEYGRNRWCY